MCREQNVVTNLVSNNRKARYESNIYPIIKYPFSNLYFDRKYPLIELNALIPAFETGITIFLRTCNVVYNITWHFVYFLNKISSKNNRRSLSWRLSMINKRVKRHERKWQIIAADWRTCSRRIISRECMQICRAGWRGLLTIWGNFAKIEVDLPPVLSLLSFQVLEGNDNNPARRWKVLIVLERGPVYQANPFQGISRGFEIYRGRKVGEF